MRLIRSLVAVTLIACIALVPTAHQASADPVGDEGDGRFKGVHTFNDNREGSKSSPPTPKSSSIVEEPEDITMIMCDGEPTVGSPYDCWDENSAPPLDLDHPTAEQLAQQLIVRLQLPTPTPQFGPDPSDNEWNMIAVGYPVWLWTEGPTTVTASESAHGYTFTLRAEYQSTTFTMGDGNTKRCTTTTVYNRSTKPGSPSPTCGHTYLQPAKHGSYTVTATTHWTINWNVATYSGTLPGTHTANRQLPVGELHAIIVK